MRSKAAIVGVTDAMSPTSSTGSCSNPTIHSEGASLVASWGTGPQAQQLIRSSASLPVGVTRKDLP